MPHSLLSRFQGILCGGFLGEKLLEGETDFLHTKMRLAMLKDFLPSENIQNCILPREINSSSSAEIILLTLPIIVFFHESQSLLIERLQQIGQLWQLEELVLQDLLLWGKSISLVLREKLNPEELLSQLVNLESETPLAGKLNLVERHLRNSQSLEQLLAQLFHQGESKSVGQSENILLALYCFSSMPEDFALSVKRAINCPNPLLTASLTGVLAGAYNGVSGIPLSWRLAAQKHPLFQESYQMAKQMFNHWVGIYQPSQMEVAPWIACHSVGIIQARSSLKIISQC